MKSPELKTTTPSRSQAETPAPFFQLKGEESLFSENDRKPEQPFFTKTGVQAKLNIHPADDVYEREADSMADQVVTHGQDTSPAKRQADPSEPQTTPLAQGISRLQLQRAFESPTTLEKNSANESAPEELLLQREPDGTGGEPTAGLENQLQGTKGQGSPLPTPTRSQMESGFGTDFGNVRVHTDAGAVQMSQDLGAQAFTHGNDIYFNEGKYDPGTKDGDHLLAHELTHTVQQGGLQQKPLQKADNGQANANVTAGGTAPAASPSVDPTSLPLSTGQMNTGQTEITFENIEIPGFKLQLHRGDLYRQRKLIRKAGYSDNSRPETSTYTTAWFNSINTDQIKNLLRPKLGPDYKTDNDTYVFKVPTGNSGKGATNNPYFFGNLESIATSLKRPNFVKKGTRYEFRSPSQLNIDHIVELQIANWDTDPWANTAVNLELLDAGINNVSKNVITGSIDKRIDSFNRSTNNAFTKNETSVNGKRKAIKENYNLNFNQPIQSTQGPASLQDYQYWEKQQIIDGEPVQALRPGHLSELEQEGKIRVFSRSGTIPMTFDWNKGGQNSLSSRERDWFKPLIITQKQFFPGENTAQLGFLTVKGTDSTNTKTKSRPGIPHFILPINRLPNATAVGEIDRQTATTKAKEYFDSIIFDSFSPLRTDYIDFAADGSPIVEGRIVTDLPLLAGQNIGFRIENGAIEIFKEFKIGDIKVPAPLKINDAGVRVFFNTEKGLGVDGSIDFGINRVGQGNITASLSISNDLNLKGSFTFDTNLFKPAVVEVLYENKAWSISGTVGIPPKQVKGIKSATVAVRYSNETLTADGSAQLDIPGVKEGSFTILYSDKEFKIGGSFQLRNDIPGIKEGSVLAEVSKVEGEEGYRVRASGTAIPNIPGISSSLSVAYDNGALSIQGDAGYSSGLLSGSVHVGATNRTISPDGQPTGEPDGTMRVYGGGSLTLQLTPWLAATAGVNFLPNGEIEVKGRIGLPAAVDVFDRREFNRNLFSIPQIEIPIFAIPLGPKSLGLVATINGGLDFTAGFGPGQIRELFGEVTYNPAQPDQTTLVGGGKFVIPADAGLTLHADLGLGLSIGFASLTGGIEVRGSLGLAGEAAASVNLNWSPATGLELNALGEINVQPKFTFDINLLARATLNLPWPLPDLSKSWRHNLYSFQWGPDMAFGITFPVHYKEGEPFDISADQVQVKYPDIEISDVAIGLAKEIKNRVFD